jgi:hypothetical protein
MDDVDMVDHLQILKAERDLDAVIAGQMPAINPYISIPIFLPIFTKYTLTEEFEEQPPDVQQRVLMACQMLTAQAAAERRGDGSPRDAEASGHESAGRGHGRKEEQGREQSARPGSRDEHYSGRSITRGRDRRQSSRGGSAVRRIMDNPQAPIRSTLPAVDAADPVHQAEVAAAAAEARTPDR